MSERFFLAQDDDGHWYLVPADKREEWHDWLEIDPECDEAWESPAGARRLDGGPSAITFSDPEGL